MISQRKTVIFDDCFKESSAFVSWCLLDFWNIQNSIWLIVLLDELKAFTLSRSISDFKNENAYFIVIKKLSFSLLILQLLIVTCSRFLLHLQEENVISLCSCPVSSINAKYIMFFSEHFNYCYITLWRCAVPCYQYRSKLQESVEQAVCWQGRWALRPMEEQPSVLRQRVLGDWRSAAWAVFGRGLYSRGREAFSFVIIAYDFFLLQLTEMVGFIYVRLVYF